MKKRKLLIPILAKRPQKTLFLTIGYVLGTVITSHLKHFRSVEPQLFQLPSCDDPGTILAPRLWEVTSAAAGYCGQEAGPRAAPPTSQKPFRGRHARTEKVWKRSGGGALSVIVCYMKQKLTGSRSTVIATAIPGVENVTRRKA